MFRNMGSEGWSYLMQVSCAVVTNYNVTDLLYANSWSEVDRELSFREY